MAAVMETIPLVLDAGGVYRIGQSRVTLDLVIRSFDRGATAEEIIQSYPSLELSDVYQVLGYYLKNQAEILPYLDRREREERELVARNPEWVPSGLRERLLARKQVK